MVAPGCTSRAVRPSSTLATKNVLQPSLVSALAIVGMFSLYLLHLGLGRLMKPDPARALAYSVTVVVIAALGFVAVVGVAFLVGRVV